MQDPLLPSLPPSLPHLEVDAFLLRHAQQVVHRLARGHVQHMPVHRHIHTYTYTRTDTSVSCLPRPIRPGLCASCLPACPYLALLFMSESSRSHHRHTAFSSIMPPLAPPGLGPCASSMPSLRASAASASTVALGCSGTK